jgi:hypothetical protein
VEIVGRRSRSAGTRGGGRNGDGERTDDGRGVTSGTNGHVNGYGAPGHGLIGMRAAGYSLVVTFEAPEVGADSWTPVAQQVGIETDVPVVIEVET